MSTSRLSTVRTLYDNRAPSYDTSTFHQQQAQDYQDYASPQSGQKFLDLACGTGNLSLGFAKSVAPNGLAIGVDVSSVSLEIARRKAQESNLANVKFIEYDVTHVGDVEEVKPVVESGGFDTITCASAMVLLEDPPAVIRRWAGLLKTGGKLIFDAPSSSSFIRGLLLEHVGIEVGIPVPFSRAVFLTLEDVAKTLSDAGLDPSKSFVSRDYAEKEEWIETADGKASEEWESVVRERGFFQAEYLDQLEASGLLEEAREIFVKRLEALGRIEGRVKQDLRMYVGVGTKV